MASETIPAVITYTKPGTVPPVFVAGTFSDPPWQPHEMDSFLQDDGEHIFRKPIQGKLGDKVQYKFRIGQGDWWVLREGDPIITDESGNVNHQLEYKAPSKESAAAEVKAPSEAEPVAKDEPTQNEPIREEPVTNAEPATKDKSTATDVPPSKDESTATDEPFSDEEPATNVEVPKDEPVAKDEPTENEPVAKDEPVSKDESAATDKLPSDDQLPSEAEVTSTDEPVAKEEPPSGEPPAGPAKPVLDHLLHIKDAETPSRSSTGTPIFARIAAEVADSAALLNEDVPDRETLAFEAKGSGVREKAPTPMGESAQTAADVADTAEALDRVDAILITEPESSDKDLLDVSAQDPYSDQKSPLFPHECLGLSEPNEDVRPPDIHDDVLPVDKSPIEDIDPDQVDLNDPTLERFPSSREEIIDTVRKLETSLNEDHASFEGAPPSPAVNASLLGGNDVSDVSLTESTAASAVPRASKHHEVPKSPQLSGSHGSASGSLQAISEADEPETEGSIESKLLAPVVFANPNMKPRPSPLEGHTSDDDEGVSLRDAVSPRTVSPLEKAVSPKTAEQNGISPPESSDLSTKETSVPESVQSESTKEPEEAKEEAAAETKETPEDTEQSEITGSAQSETSQPSIQEDQTEVTEPVESETPEPAQIEVPKPSVTEADQTDIPDPTLPQNRGVAEERRVKTAVPEPAPWEARRPSVEDVAEPEVAQPAESDAPELLVAITEQTAIPEPVEAEVFEAVVEIADQTETSELKQTKAPEELVEDTEELAAPAVPKSMMEHTDRSVIAGLAQSESSKAVVEAREQTEAPELEESESPKVVAEQRDQVGDSGDKPVPEPRQAESRKVSVEDTDLTNIPEPVQSESPEVATEDTEETEAADGKSTPVIPSAPATLREIAESAASTAVETPAVSQEIRKRGLVSETEQQDGEAAGPPSPASTNSLGVRAPHGAKPGWIQALFRVLFVDWIGGLITRLCGSRRSST
ncbi:hypothetical protein QBC44DRAFT_5492 [Cladorrhinum sp. PSN332]|nr:hypothetical protein QBC44DRAFT_5492 [Cladorrhinum sp. PSN332]